MIKTIEKFIAVENGTNDSIKMLIKLELKIDQSLFTVLSLCFTNFYVCRRASHQSPPKYIEATHKRSIRVIILVSRVIAMLNFSANKVIKITLIWSYLTLFESI